MKQPPLSPDGWFYVQLARGERVPQPYARRWLLPWLLGPDTKRWAALTYASLALTPVAAWSYFGAMGLDGAPRIFASALLCILPGVWRCSLRFPVLLDAPSLALCLALAAVAKLGPWWLTMACAVVGGAVNEKIPVFGALWGWSPFPLLGMLGVGWWKRGANTDIPWLTHPVCEALKLRRTIGLDASLYLRPFGAALIGLAAPSWQMAATVVVAHLQLAAAQDTIRLAIWCAPVMVLGAAKVLPSAWWALALLVTVMQKDDRV